MYVYINMLFIEIVELLQIELQHELLHIYKNYYTKIFLTTQNI